MGDSIKPEDLLERAREDYVMSMPGEPSPADAADFDAMVERGFMIESQTIIYGWKGTPKDRFVSAHSDLNGQVDALRFFESQVARIGKTGLPDYQPHVTKVERMIRVVSTWYTTTVEEEPSSAPEAGTKTRFVASHMLLPGDVVLRVMGPRGDDIIVEVERPPVTDQAHPVAHKTRDGSQPGDIKAFLAGNSPQARVLGAIAAERAEGED